MKLLSLSLDLHPRSYVLSLSPNVRVQVHEEALTWRVHRQEGRRQYWVEFTDLFLALSFTHLTLPTIYSV